MLNSFTTNEMRRKCEENQIHRNLGINGKYAKSIDTVNQRVTGRPPTAPTTTTVKKIPVRFLMFETACFTAIAHRFAELAQLNPPPFVAAEKRKTNNNAVFKCRPLAGQNWTFSKDFYEL